MSVDGSVPSVASHRVSWLSYQASHRREPSVVLGCESTAVTVILDCEAQDIFSGIRLLVVCNKTASGLDLKELSLWSSLQPGGGVSEDIAHRTTLLHRKRARGYNSASLSTLPICTVVFELYLLPTTSTISLRLRPQSSLDTLEHLYILHDLRYPFPRLYATFSTWGHVWPCSLSDVVHGVRILPAPVLRNGTSTIAKIPKDILINIIRYALGKRDRGWRNALMSYGTVCRAWAPTLDLFFEGAQSRHIKDRPSAASVSRALEQRPDRRHLLNTFLPMAYREYYDNGAYFTFSQACVRILQLAPALQNVHLPIVLGLAWEETVKVLRSLHGVRRCTLTSHRPSAVFRPYSIDDVQAIVGGWKHLGTLRCESWTPGISSDEISQQQYYLKELRLVAGHITGPQLLRFLPSPRSSTLKRLYLTSVSGLTNRDMYTILCLVAPTLASLHIQSTPTPRAMDEPYALDAAIASMPHLKSVTLNGDYASALTISRKHLGPSKTGEGPPEVRGTITLVMQTESVHAENLVRALETTGWKHVMVWWNRRMEWNTDTPWNERRFAMGAPRIQARGVHLRFRFFDKSMRLTPDLIEYKLGWTPMLLELF